MSDPTRMEPAPEARPARRKRYQRGSLQKRKSGRSSVWVCFWWENGSRRGRTLGRISQMTQGEAQAAMAALLQPLNGEAGQPAPTTRLWTLKAWIGDAYLPFCLRKWKPSTARTTQERIRYHLIRDLGDRPLGGVDRDRLQQYLEAKAASGLSYSVVNHLRWDLRAIFRLAVQDGVLTRSPAESLFVTLPRTASRKVLNAGQVQQILSVLDLREELIVRLGIFSGMRPGEILALQWKHVYDDHVLVEQRLYKGQLNTPKTTRSRRQVALSPGTLDALARWHKLRADSNENGWVFPTERGTPLWRDNLWRQRLLPRLEKIGLEWANFQVMRRTHASLSRKAGIDPKLVADQLGHGIGVNIDTYTVAGLDQRLAAVHALESSLIQ